MGKVTDIRFKLKLSLNDGRDEMEMNNLVAEKELLVEWLPHINNEMVDKMREYALKNEYIDTTSIDTMRGFMWERLETIINKMRDINNSKGE
jgi:hypothetical protein